MKTLARTTLILFVLTTRTFAAADETKAVTEDGRTVLLKKDGTWREMEKSLVGVRAQYDAIKTASKLYQPVVASTRFYYDPGEWLARINAADEVKKTFDGKGGFFGAVIAEKLPVSVDILKRGALANMQNAATEVEVLEEATHKVNGVNVEYMKYRAVVKGMRFTYHGNFYANADGVIQVVCGTLETLEKKEPAKCLDFINGLKVE